MTCNCVRCGAFALHDALCDIQFVFNLYYRFVSEQSGIGTFFILLIWLSAKRCACKGLCTSVENKTLLKTVFIWNVVLCTCMNEWIYSTDNFSNQAVVDFKIQSSHSEKAPKNDRQKQTSMFRVIFVTLLTNCKQLEKQSLICTRKTSFCTDNITSTLTIVVFSINWSRMFALYVYQMCCKLELKMCNVAWTNSGECVMWHALTLESV